MLKRVQTFPLAMQALLGLKGDGPPNILSDNVSPVIDFTTFYALQKRETVLLTQIAGVVISSQVFSDGTVPSGEIWYVWAFTTSVAIPVAGALKYSPIFVSTTSVSVSPARAGLASERLCISSAAPFWMTPGDSLGVFVEQVTGVNNIGGAVVISRLRL
jgi:hypothetical protein